MNTIAQHIFTIALVATVLVLTPGGAFALDPEDAVCATAVVKRSAKVAKAYGKAAAKCVKLIGKDKVDADSVGACLDAAVNPKTVVRALLGSREYQSL